MYWRVTDTLEILTTLPQNFVTNIVQLRRISLAKWLKLPFRHNENTRPYLYTGSPKHVQLQYARPVIN